VAGIEFKAIPNETLCFSLRPHFFRRWTISAGTPELIAAVENPEAALDSGRVRSISHALHSGDGAPRDFCEWLRDKAPLE
jgi:hypothetical protein